MSDDLIERLRRAAKNAEETRGWLANHEDAENLWTEQDQYEQDAKAILEAADALAAKDTAISETRAELERARAALKEIARKGRTTGYGRGALSAIAARALSQDEPADLGVGG